MSYILWAYAKDVGAADFIRLYFIPYIVRPSPWSVVGSDLIYRWP